MIEILGGAFLFKWKLRDIVLLALIAFLFGAVFIGANMLWTVLDAALVPLGLEPFATEILFGLWIIPGPVAAALIPRVGSATLGEVLASIAEMLYGAQFGFSVIIDGIVQGIGSELGFTLRKYRHPESFQTLALSALTVTLVSYFYSFYKSGYNQLSLEMNLALIIVRFLSAFIVNVVFVRLILALFNRSENLRHA